MSLIACPECNKQISDTVNVCPNCGFQLTQDKITEIKVKDKKKRKIYRLGCFSTIVIFIFICSFIYEEDSFENIKFVDNIISVDYSIDSESHLTSRTIADKIYQMAIKHPTYDKIKIHIYFTGSLYNDYGSKISTPIDMGVLLFDLNIPRQFEVSAYYGAKWESNIRSSMRHQLKYGEIFK